MKKFFESFNFYQDCQRYNIRIWQCPQFIFLMMGLIIIFSTIITNYVARNYFDPYILDLIVLAETGLLFIINYILVSSFERIVQAIKTKADFISIISHRLRTPLSAVKWQLDLLMSKKVEWKEEEINRSYLEIQSQNEKMINIVNTLLDLNLFEENKLILYPSSFSLKKVVEEIIKLETPAARKANLSFSFEAPEGLPNVFADRIKIKNILYDLFDNAIRYSIRKGTIAINLEVLSKTIRVLITDEGVGISPRDAKNVFDKFFRGREALYYKTEGSGLGLYLAKAIVEKSGGEIGFSSIEGRGSTFWFTLPVG